MSYLLPLVVFLLFPIAISKVSFAASAQAAFTPPLAEQIATQTKRCLSLPAAASRGSYRAVLDVTFADGVAGEIRVGEVDPPGRTGLSVVEAAARAIERCGPFPVVEDGEITLIFESEE